MRKSLLPALLVTGCATHVVDPGAIASLGDAIETAPTPGEAFTASYDSIDGLGIEVPDPEGRVVVIELIRSADW
jgi:hypothetical protein